jgi:hypothetical protein
VAVVRKRSSCQPLRVEGVAWSAQRIPTSVNLFSRPEPLLFHASSSSFVLTWLSGPRSRKSSRAENRTRDLSICSQKLWPLGHRGGQSRNHTIKVEEKYGSILNKNSASKYTDTPDDDPLGFETCRDWHYCKLPLLLLLPELLCWRIQIYCFQWHTTGCTVSTCRTYLIWIHIFDETLKMVPYAGRNI